jgi:hypothetical protein
MKHQESKAPDRKTRPAADAAQIGMLVICTGNSCKSQMAEGCIRALSNQMVVKSAGITAHGLHRNPRNALGWSAYFQAYRQSDR